MPAINSAAGWAQPFAMRDCEGSGMGALDAESIRVICAEQGVSSCGVQVFDSLPSTNAWLLQNLGGDQYPQLCATELQTAGRGRRGKQWSSPRGGVTFSLRRHFNLPPAKLGGLSLVTGCAVLAALASLGIEGTQLKWPNDVLHAGKKLGGLLIELGSAADGTTTVTGIGLNYCASDSAQSIDQPFIELAQLLDELPDRNRLIATLAVQVLDAYTRYEQHGFGAFRSRWLQHDVCLDRTVRLSQASGAEIIGIGRGVDASGALKIETDSGVEIFHAGEVSVRIQA